ncbi:MAG: hypothetical protein U1E50_17555 [Caulobacteraceae bacterium]
MTYIKVQWLHDSLSEPVLLYSELDADRFEVRKIEVFANRRHGYAADGFEKGGSHLGVEPVPPLSEIGRDPQFVPVEIEASEFEAVWRRATDEHETP